jgi:mono/diheme cytochrome c family protein
MSSAQLSRLIIFPLVIAALFAADGCDRFDYGARGRGYEIERYESVPELGTEEIGAARFLFDDFNGLSTETLEASAVPWKLAATVLLLNEHPGETPNRDALRAQLQRYGLFKPVAVRNWPLKQPPEFAWPMGLVVGAIERRVPSIELEVATIGCASCHAGTLYDAQGAPTFEAWLGTPNTSLDLDGYADAVFSGLRAYRKQPEVVFTALRTLFPQTSHREITTLRRFVWPLLNRRMVELEREGAALPFRNGGPGRSHGIDALNLRLGLPVHDADGSATVSIPSLGDRVLRSSLLVDGLYAAKGGQRFVGHQREGVIETAERQSTIVGFFTVATMGVPHRQAPEGMPRIAETLRFLDRHAAAPLFPGALDMSLAARGAALYAERCAGCHGRYVEVDGRPRLQEFPNRLVSLAEIGTDPDRARGVDEALLQRIRASTLNRYLDAEATDGYVAPILTGVWATAPYLHNGSVPTLWHLFNPAQRPQRFMVGGHRLDLHKVGIDGVDALGGRRYPLDYVPWADAQWYDTALPGRDRRGHEAQVLGLDAEQQMALIEYLKRL